MPTAASSSEGWCAPTSVVSAGSNAFWTITHRAHSARATGGANLTAWVGSAARASSVGTTVNGSRIKFVVWLNRSVSTFALERDQRRALDRDGDSHSVALSWVFANPEVIWDAAPDAGSPSRVLLDEEGHASRPALLDGVDEPRQVHRPEARSALTTDNEPVEPVCEIGSPVHWAEHGLVADPSHRRAFA
jgi:hypothetical protein